MQPGNHIKVWKGCYYHHGIYVGAGQVIHYKSHGIILTTLEEFSQGRSVEIVHHKNQDFNRTVERAYERLGEDLYNLFINNCESFANWCVYGKNESKQVNGIMSMLIELLFR